VAKQNIEQIFSEDISKAKMGLNFWLNFSLNFRDESFIKMIKLKEGDRCEFINKKIKEILVVILKFLNENLFSKGK
jgi:hypothetical protein